MSIGISGEDDVDVDDAVATYAHLTLHQQGPGRAILADSGDAGGVGLEQQLWCRCTADTGNHKPPQAETADERVSRTHAELHSIAAFFVADSSILYLVGSIPVPMTDGSVARGGCMSLIKDVVMSASVAIGNAASRERDRELETVHDDGRPKALGERARQRWNAMIGEGFGKVVVSQTAHLGAKELAKRVGNETAKRVFTEIGKRPIVAASTALFAFDVARDGVRLAKGSIDGREFAERVGGNGVGLVGAAGGAWVGSMLGTFAMPVVGTAVGSVIGGVIGGIGGDTYGRAKVRSVMGLGNESDDERDDDFEDEDEDDEGDDE
jgi:hypothetical protein